MEFKLGLHRTGVLDVEATRRDAERAGFTAFVLPTKGIVDRVSFFDAVRATFPLDPLLVRSHSWDALSDSLWEGLLAHSSERIAVVWQGTGAMAASAASDFDTALNVLADVATLLGDQRATGGGSKEIVILVE